MAAIRSVGLAVALAGLLGAGRAWAVEGTRWRAGSGGSQVVVDVYRKGLLSGMAHDHRFSAGQFRGRERPVTVTVRTMPEAKGLRVRGSARFRQSDFGIEPHGGFLGMVAVEDEIQVDFNLLLEREP